MGKVVLAVYEDQLGTESPELNMCIRYRTEDGEERGVWVQVDDELEAYSLMVSGGEFKRSSGDDPWEYVYARCAHLLAEEAGEEP